VAHADGTTNILVALPFPKPSYGIAVDGGRKRVYVSDWEYNRVFVYSTAGVLLYTIHN
jgi:DNA-binding beta-propeller fold protein YncE